jgi:hypothetical protein
MLTAVAPQYAADPRASTFLALAAGRLSPAFFGEQFVQACAFFAAHMLTMADREVAARAGGAAGAPTGAITSISTGGVSIGYGSSVMTGDDPDLASTWYGRQFLDIRRGRSGGGARLATVDG